MKKITVDSPDVKVIKRDYVYATVRNYWNVNPDVLSDNEVEEVYQKLKPLTDINAATKSAHIDAIKKKYGEKPASISEPTNESQAKNSTLQAEPEKKSLICPLCGKPLILRTAKRGSNAGSQFYGCSGFPSCRYTKGIIE